MKRIIHSRRGLARIPASLVTLAAIMLVDSAPAQTTPDETEQVVRAVEGFVRNSEERGSATTGQLKEQRTAAVDVVSKPRTSSPSMSVVLGDQWIFDADAALYDDFDDDGYYRYLSVRFDADTYLPSVYVYAMLYLSADGETWEHYYTTEDFLIGGTVPDDEYFVETDLVTGYPPGLYDVLIELYDAEFGTFSDEFGPADSSALSLLPLEDAEFDVPPLAVSVSTGHGGGGAFSWLMLPALLLGSGRNLSRALARVRGMLGRVIRWRPTSGSS